MLSLDRKNPLCDNENNGLCFTERNLPQMGKERGIVDITAYTKTYLEAYTPYKSYWNYEDGCVLKGCIDVYRALGDRTYRDFVLRYLETYVTPEGDIPNYESRKFNIDSINSGKALFFGLEETGDGRYRKAIEYHMQRLDQHPRCVCGNFWHKENYPCQVWLDGLYMAQPFYMEYEVKFDGMKRVQDIIGQFSVVREHLYNEEKGLNYHAWDEAKKQPWCDPKTGLSPNFWLRSTGWYLMALVDCIALHDDARHTLAGIFRESMDGLLRYQDAETGLFYQVIDHGETPGNYTETSGSAMAAYALLKGVRIGVLDKAKYLPIGLRIFDSLTENKLKKNAAGKTELTDICWVAGLGPGEKRDGSVAYYLSEPRVSDDSKGVGPFMMAWAESLLARKE